MISREPCRLPEKGSANSLSTSTESVILYCRTKFAERAVQYRLSAIYSKSLFVRRGDEAAGPCHPERADELMERPRGSRPRVDGHGFDHALGCGDHRHVHRRQA
jgi:hypothetical protein